jgi:hypothetical protein
MSRKRLYNSLEKYWIITDCGYTSPCHIWRGTIDNTGYGQYYSNKKHHRAHRFVFEWYGGIIPEEMKLDHLCRQKACVNVKHLEVVTNAENIRRGSLTKLNAELAQNIREDYRLNNYTQRQLAKKYKISRSIICGILNNERWAV